jgi:hypothetical protein
MTGDVRKPDVSRRTARSGGGRAGSQKGAEERDRDEGERGVAAVAQGTSKLGDA